MSAVDTHTAERLLGARLLRTFVGTEPTPELLGSIRAGRAGGVTIFRFKNVASPAQMRALTAALQAARPAGDPPLVIGADQEGGQLQAIGEGATAWPGNLALGATGSEDLAYRTGRSIAAECAAMGITLVFAPVCDLLRREASTALGTRAFGDDPALVGRLAAAMTRGIQDGGVAAVLKHFPGHGAAAADSHHGLPVVAQDPAALRLADLVPFHEGIASGARLVLAGHLAVPALTGGEVVAATVARPILQGLLREELGFGGVTISDAMDMRGAGEPGRLPETAVAAVAAGLDLLTLVHPHPVEDAALDALVRAALEGRLDPAELARAHERIDALRTWMGRVAQPTLEVVDSVEHRALARETAERAVTLVRDHVGLLPLRAGSGTRVALVAPTPVDLTPAETSSTVPLALGGALRRRGLTVDEFVPPLDPGPDDVAGLVGAVAAYDVAVVGTFDAPGRPGQTALVRAMVAAGQPTVAVALRGPFDLEAYPAVPTYACTYGVQPPLMEALADALVGRIPFAGRLPVQLHLEPALPVEPRTADAVSR